MKPHGHTVGCGAITDQKGEILLMSSVEASIAVMSKVLESQRLMAQLVAEAGRIMAPDSATASDPTTELQAEVSAAIAGLGRVIDLVI